MKRRGFIRNICVIIPGTGFYKSVFHGINAQTEQREKSSHALKGFIVSDAHFGWIHKEQPAPEVQSLMMERIMTRFPDLDVFIDTGDAHHGALKDDAGNKARGQWTDIIAGGCDIVPFFYVAGNHEIIGTLEQYDQEWLCNKMGSVTCRPYYSFDIKGIHFISLPELLQPTYISNETIEWMKLDLDVNKDRTVIILSHNNIKDTTSPLGEPGYRGIVNSQDLLQLFSEYPGIIAWMHGHNHSYEIVQRNRMMYVSNGRIGGFVPPLDWGKVGQGHLGGIYFEVRRDELIVRCYSATENEFLDKLGYSHLSARMETATSFNSKAKPAYSYGYGSMLNGQRIPAFIHHASSGRNNEIFLKRLNNPAFNEDPIFSLFEFRNAGTSRYQWLLMGTSVGTPGYFEKENKLWRWENPGIRLLAQDKIDKPVVVSIPDWRFSRYCYYRCVPGMNYKLLLHLETPAGGQQLSIVYRCFDREGNELTHFNGPVWIIEKGEKIYESSFEMPVFSDHQNIYNDPESDNLVQLTVTADFTRMENDLIIKKFEIMFHPEKTIFSDLSSETVLPQDNYPYSSPEIQTNKDINIIHEKDGRIVIQADAENHKRITWLLRQNNIDWQVRNALVSDQGQFLEINGWRNTWSAQKEIIIVPLTEKDKIFVHRLRNIERSRIYPLNRDNQYVRIEILKCTGQGTIMVYSERKPKVVKGASEWLYEKQMVMITVQQGSEITIYC